MLKRKVKSLDEVKPEHRSLYRVTEDGFVLELEGGDGGGGEGGGGGGGGDDALRAEIAELKARIKAKDAKIGEFREGNHNLQNERDRLKKQYEGIDTERYSKGQAALAQIESQVDRELLEAGRYQEYSARIRQKVVDEYEKKLEELQAQFDGTKATTDRQRAALKEARIQLAVRDQASAMKLNFNGPAALHDIYARAGQMLDLDEDNQLVRYEGEGENRRTMMVEGRQYGAEHFLKGTLEEAPHLFADANMPKAGGPHLKRGAGGKLAITVDPNDNKGMSKVPLEKIVSGEIDVNIQGGL